jgi:uncharacterized protein YodC (DUF2158 family)
MGVDTGQVFCEWFDNKNNAMTRVFSETSLKVCPPSR